MINYSTSVILAVIILIVAVPYVSWVRNRAQKPVAAYFIFVIAFVTSGLVLFGVLTWVVWRAGLDAALNRPVPAVIFLILVFVPAIAIGTALVRKPPSKAREPD